MGKRLMLWWKDSFWRFAFPAPAVLWFLLRALMTSNKRGGVVNFWVETAIQAVLMTAATGVVLYVGKRAMLREITRNKLRPRAYAFVGNRSGVASADPDVLNVRVIVDGSRALHADLEVTCWRLNVTLPPDRRQRKHDEVAPQPIRSSLNAAGDIELNAEFALTEDDVAALKSPSGWSYCVEIVSGTVMTNKESISLAIDNIGIVAGLPPPDRTPMRPHGLPPAG